MINILKIYIGEYAYTGIKALLKSEGIENVNDYYKNYNQEKIIENLENKFDKEEFEEIKKILLEKATNIFLGKNEMVKGEEELLNYSNENYIIDFRKMLNDYINLDKEQFVWYYRRRNNITDRRLY